MKTKTEGHPGLSSNNSKSKFLSYLNSVGEKTEDRREDRGEVS